MKLHSAIPLFLFLVLSITPAYALTPLSNTSLTLNYNPRGFGCLNQSDNKIYCYAAADNGGTTHYIYRWNETGTKVSCTLPVTYSGGSYFSVVNETYAIVSYGTASCYYYNITNIASGSCTLVFGNNNASESCTGSGAIASGDSYGSSVYSVKNKIIYTLGGDQISNMSSAWSMAANATGLTIPNKSDNTTYYFYTWTPDNPILKFFNDGYDSQYPPLSTLFGIRQGYLALIAVNATTTMGYVLEPTTSTGNQFYRLNWSLVEQGNYTDCNYTATAGTVCDQTDPLNRRYVTTDVCSQTYGNCQAGTICSQVTPQLNVTSSLIENYTYCGVKTTLGFWLPCTSICWGSSVLITNCAPECAPYSCGDTPLPSWLTPPRVYHAGDPYVVNVPQYTIACINSTSGNATVIIDNHGNTTTEAALWQSGFNGTCPSNTTAVCYDALCNPVSCYSSSTDSIQGMRTWTNAGFKSPYAADLISLLIAAGTAIALYMKVNDKKIEILLAPFILIASIFSFIGFLTPWFIIFEAAMLFVLIFWKVKAGN